MKILVAIVVLGLGVVTGLGSGNSGLPQRRPNLQDDSQPLRLLRRCRARSRDAGSRAEHYMDNLRAFAVIPEPSTTMLGILGAVTLLGVRRRKQS